MDVKICGIKTPEVLQACCVAGVDYVGFVFVEKSPRYIMPDTAKTLCDLVSGHTKTVGLFQDHKISHVVETSLYTGVDIIQLHGSESVEYVKSVQQQTQKPIIKAFGIHTPSDFQTAILYDDVCAYLLFDTPPPTGSDVNGGHGVCFDWDILHDMPKFNTPWFLAGGICKENIPFILENPHITKIDVSGGVESEKGIKDIEKIYQLMADVCDK